MPCKQGHLTNYGEVEVITFTDNDEGREVKDGVIDTGTRYHFNRGIVISAPNHGNEIPTIYILGLNRPEIDRSFDILDEALNDTPYKKIMAELSDRIENLEQLIDDAREIIEAKESELANGKY